MVASSSIVVQRYPLDVAELAAPVLEELLNERGRLASDICRSKWTDQWLQNDSQLNTILSYLEECVGITGLECVGWELLLVTFFTVVEDVSMEQEELAWLALKALHEQFKKRGEQRNVFAEDSVLEWSRLDEPIEEGVDQAGDETELLREVVVSLQHHIISPAGQLKTSALHTAVVKVLQTLRNIPGSQSRTERFRKLVKETGLSDCIEEIARPGFLSTTDEVSIHRMFRYYRLDFSLSEVLHSWVPKEIRSTWSASTPRLYLEQATSYRIRRSYPKDLLKAFRYHPWLVAHQGDPSAVFFLLTRSTFLHAWQTWLLPGLMRKGYQVDGELIKDPAGFYPTLKTYVQQLVEDKTGSRLVHYEGVQNLADIFRFTVDAWCEKAKVRERLDQQPLRKEGRLGCAICRDLPEGERCVQERVLEPRFHDEDTKQRFVEAYDGTSVSKAERVMAPRHNVNEVRIVRPDVLNLNARIQSDPVILSRCHRQVIYIIDSRGTRDFVAFGMFEPADIKVLTAQLNAVQYVSPLRRSGLLQTWDSGRSMFPHGSRISMGGRPGDTYAHYAGIHANDGEAIKFLFNQAKSAYLILETTRRIEPTVANEIRDASKYCDRVGFTGANLFNCMGYLSILHRDRDASPSVSLQLEKEVNESLEEFDFIEAEQGYSIATEVNCLWSFRSARLHGTMIPSQETADQLRIGPMSLHRGGEAATKSSAGIHITVTKVNAKKATDLHVVRGTFDQRTLYWKDL